MVSPPVRWPVRAYCFWPDPADQVGQEFGRSLGLMAPPLAQQVQVPFRANRRAAAPSPIIAARRFSKALAGDGSGGSGAATRLSGRRIWLALARQIAR